MDWFYEIKEGFIVPRTGFEPVTYGLEICWVIEIKLKNIVYSIASMSFFVRIPNASLLFSILF